MHVGYVEDRVAQGHVFLQVIQFFLASFIPKMFYIH